MAISRERKEELLATYKQQIEESNGLILANYSALTVPSLEAARGQALEQDGQIFVIKNTLFRLALQEQGFEPPEDLFSGPLIAAFCHQDVPPLAKMLIDFAKEVDVGALEISGGFMDERFLSVDEVKAIAELPSRDELLAQVLRGIQAPATQVAGVVAGGVRQVLNVVKAYVDKLEEGAEASPETAEAAA